MEKSKMWLVAGIGIAGFLIVLAGGIVVMVIAAGIDKVIQAIFG